MAKKRIKTSAVYMNVTPSTKEQMDYHASRLGLSKTEYFELIMDTYQTLHARNAALMRLLEKLEFEGLGLPYDISVSVAATRKAIRIIDTGPTQSTQSQS